MPIDSVGADSIVSCIQSQCKAAQGAGRVSLSRLLNILEKVHNNSIKFTKFQVINIKADLNQLDDILRKQGSRKEEGKLGAIDNIRKYVNQNISASTAEGVKRFPEEYKSVIQGNLAILEIMRPALVELYERAPCKAISQMDFNLMDNVLADSGVREVGTNGRGDVVQTPRQIEFERLLQKLREGPETKPIYDNAFEAWKATLPSASSQNA